MQFYDSLNNMYTEAPNQDIRIILRDLNAKVSKEEYVKTVAENHSLHDLTKNMDPI